MTTSEEIVKKFYNGEINQCSRISIRVSMKSIIEKSKIIYFNECKCSYNSNIEFLQVGCQKLIENYYRKEIKDTEVFYEHLGNKKMMIY